jgi:hypothetical protein
MPDVEDSFGLVCCPLRLPSFFGRIKTSQPDPFGVVCMFGRKFGYQPNNDDIGLLAREADRIAAVLWGCGITEQLNTE